MGSLTDLELDVEATISALGYLDDAGVYQKEFDCEESVNDLIRYLRRDDAATCNVRRMLGRAGVVGSDLIPILASFPEQRSLWEAVVKLLLNLTQPTRAVFEKRSEGGAAAKGFGALVQEAATHLRAAKRAFVNEELLGQLNKHMAAFLAKDWEDQAESDRLAAERILLLLRNVLEIPSHAPNVHRTEGQQSLQDELILALDASGWLQTLVKIAAEGEPAWQLHFLQTAHLLLSEHDEAEPIGRAGQGVGEAEERREKEMLDRLVLKEQETRRQRAKLAGARHSRFAGSYTVTGVPRVGGDGSTDQPKADGIVAHRVVKDPNHLDWIHKRKVSKRKPKNRRPFVAEEEKHRSALPVRLKLRAFCVQVLETAFEPLMRSVKSQLSRNVDGLGSRSEAGDSYFLWALRWFGEVCRTGELGPQHFQAQVSQAIFHYVHVQLEQCLEMGQTEKQGPEARLWGLRARLALRAFLELMEHLQLLLRSDDGEKRRQGRSLLHHLFYLPEYRDLCPNLLKRFNPVYMPKAFLRDTINLTHLYLRLLEKESKKAGQEFKVEQRKKKAKKRKAKAGKKSGKSGAGGGEEMAESEAAEPTEEELERVWEGLAGELSALVQGSEEDLPTEGIIPFDPLTEEAEQRPQAMRSVQAALRAGQAARALAMYRAARRCFPHDDIFGAQDEEAEAEFCQLKEIHETPLPPAPKVPEVAEAAPPSPGPEEDLLGEELEGGYSDSEEEAQFESKETEFDFKAFVQGALARPDVLQWYVWALEDFQTNSEALNHSIVKLFHRVAFELDLPGLLYHVRLFSLIQRIHKAPPTSYVQDSEELLGFSRQLLRSFFATAAVDTAERNGTIWPSLLFWRSRTAARTLVSGEDELPAARKAELWPEELEMELRNHYHEFQALLEPPEDLSVLDWCLSNLSTTRSLKQIRRKLRELGYADLPKLTRDGHVAKKKERKEKKVRADPEHVASTVDEVAAGALGDSDVFIEEYFSKLDAATQKSAHKSTGGGDDFVRSSGDSDSDSDGGERFSDASEKPLADIFIAQPKKAKKKKKTKRREDKDDLFDDGQSSSDEESGDSASDASSPPRSPAASRGGSRPTSKAATPGPPAGRSPTASPAAKRARRLVSSDEEEENRPLVIVQEEGSTPPSSPAKAPLRAEPSPAKSLGGAASDDAASPLRPANNRTARILSDSE